MPLNKEAESETTRSDEHHKWIVYPKAKISARIPLFQIKTFATLYSFIAYCILFQSWKFTKKSKFLRIAQNSNSLFRNKTIFCLFPFIDLTAPTAVYFFKCCLRILNNYFKYIVPKVGAPTLLEAMKLPKELVESIRNNGLLFTNSKIKSNSQYTCFNKNKIKSYS